MTSHMIEE